MHIALLGIPGSACRDLTLDIGSFGGVGDEAEALLLEINISNNSAWQEKAAYVQYQAIRVEFGGEEDRA